VSTLRDYQRRAIESVHAHWSDGGRAVCLVAPTGAGKTRMGEELIDCPEPVVWVAHRRELIQQTSKRLAARFGAGAVGVIMPGEYAKPRARVQVATVQTLLAREVRPLAGRLVLDEAHHYAAEDWRALADAYGSVPTLGLTATPERQDGKPLGDIFGRLVVSASYSDLIAGGYLVPARVHRPDATLGNDLAQDPVTAWRLYSEGSRAFVFCGRVYDAYAWAQKFRDAGVVAAVVEAGTARGERDEALARFAAGKVRVIVNVNTMTEGVDVPEARTIVLARAFGHVGGYLQAVGRALRPAKDKPDMILIDLTGTSRRHGLPTDDRVYSLDGSAISATGPERGGGGVAEWSQEIRGVELRMVARGALPLHESVSPIELSPADVGARRDEYDRLVVAARRAGLRDGFAAAAFRRKFGEAPPAEWAK
jgi:superfamily II DNA or RNA helicase